MPRRILARAVPRTEVEGLRDAFFRHMVANMRNGVGDTGPGVTTEVADKMFNPFFTTKPQGSGLGLAIVCKIVDAHEGRIDVSSVPDRGTTFRVTLPVALTHAWDT